MKELKDMTVDELLAVSANNTCGGGGFVAMERAISEIARRAKEWEDFKEKNKEKWTIAGIILTEMQNEKENR